MRCVKTRYVGICLLILLVVIAASRVTGEIPRKVNYQVKLTDAASGAPIAQSVYLTFRLYAENEGGDALWKEERMLAQPDSSGVITMILGRHNPLDPDDFDGPLWLEVEVEVGVGETYKLLPRRELVSVPYSFRAMDSDHALNSDSLGGRYWEEYVGGTLPSGSEHQTLRHDGSNWVADSMIYNTGSHVGIGTTSPFHTLDVENTRDEQSAAIRGVSSTTGTDQLVHGVWGETSSQATQSAGSGVFGHAKSPAGASSGVKGEAAGSEGMGVYGYATHEDGENYGVYGKTLSPNGYAGYFEGGQGVLVTRPTSSHGMVRIQNSLDGDNEASIGFWEGQDAGFPDVWTAGVGGYSCTNDFIIARDGVRFLITPDGNVGLGTEDPGTDRLRVEGSACATGGWNTCSDLRFKEGVKGIGDALTKVVQLRGVSFNWKTHEYENKGFPEGEHFGVIAQEAEEILPQVVRESSAGEKAVAYAEIIPLLIEAIKTQQGEIESLRSEIAELKRIEALEEDRR